MQRALKILSLLLLTLGATSVRAEAPKTVRVGYLDLVNAQLVTKHLKLLSKEMPGVNVKYIQMNNPGDMLRALAAGQLDFGSLGNPPAAIAITRGLPIKGILNTDMLGRIEALVVRKSDKITSLAELKGKRIGTVFGSTSHYELLNAFKLQGIDPATMKLMDLAPPDIVNAWMRGDIDAAYFWEPGLSKTLAHGGKILIDSGEMAKRGFPTWDVDVVTNDFASKYPRLVTAFVKAGCAGIDYWNANPKKAAGMVADELSLPKKQVEHMMAGESMTACKAQLTARYLGTPAKKGEFVKTLVSTAKFLVSQDRLPKLLPEQTFADFIEPVYLQQVVKP